MKRRRSRRFGTTGGDRDEVVVTRAPRDVRAAIQLLLGKVLATVVIDYAAKSEDQERSIARTAAKQQYALTDGDLAALPRELRANPYGRSAAPMTLFNVWDVQCKAVDKHGSLSALQTVLDKRRLTAAKRRTTVSRRQDDRRHQLEEALQRRGLELRTDSRLCAGYIDGTLSLTVEQVCRSMEEMRFFFAHTTYEACFDDAKEAARDHKGYYDVDECSDVAKCAALRDYVETLYQQALASSSSCTTAVDVLNLVPVSLQPKARGYLDRLTAERPHKRRRTTT